MPAEDRPLLWRALLLQPFVEHGRLHLSSLHAAPEPWPRRSTHEQHQRSAAEGAQIPKRVACERGRSVSAARGRLIGAAQAWQTEQTAKRRSCAHEEGPHDVSPHPTQEVAVRSPDLGILRLGRRPRDWERRVSVRRAPEALHFAKQRVLARARRGGGNFHQPGATSSSVSSSGWELE